MNDKQEINKQQTKFLTNNKHLLTKVETNKNQNPNKLQTNSKIETDEQTTQKQQMSNKPSIVKVFRNKQTAKR